MRLFTVVDVPDSLREALSAFQDEGDLDVRWTSPEQFHVTLRFIGDVDEERARQYEAALSGVEVPPAQCIPYGLDVLPSRRSPRVLMLGLERTGSIMTLYEAVSDVLGSEGLKPEGRTYRPHVTIARLDDARRESVHAFLQAHEERSYDPFEADQFILYESTLTPEGALHEPVAAYELAS